MSKRIMIVDDAIFMRMKLKDILEKNGLTTLSFETMCNRCGCCDIVPFVDIK